MLTSFLTKIFGSKHEREVKKLQPLVAAISALEPAMKKLSDAELAAKTAEFRQKLDQGAPLDELLVPTFAVVREAGRRVLGLRHYDVQLIGGMVLHQGKIAEMKTGEGKTLVATLPCYLNALSGKGVHVVTVNDYLARRDAEWMGKLYGFLGMSTGVVVPQQPNAAKKRAYLCDITYGQNNEFGFDYLRDNMKFSIYDYAQRDLHFAIVDEVDSILVDEARTPLIISGPGETASDKYQKINELVPRLRKDEHYEVDEKGRNATLTEEGMELGQRILHERGLTEVENLYDPTNLETLHILQQALRAHVLYQRDKHYMVTPEGKILIIDEFTGRALPGRRWSDGLHQSVEAKERVPIQEENITLATISFQNLFRLYKKLAGMTGTADTEAAEFHKIYNLDVVVIPTNQPVTRQDHEDLVYKTEREKFRAVVDEIADCHERGQPVLVGTTSVEKSDALSRLLEKKGIRHNVLNAKQHEREAYVVAQAGVPGGVTVATNMAGRGTDILLGGNPEMLARLDVLSNATEEQRASREALEEATREATVHYVEKCKVDGAKVREVGGLHIVGTERHESRRIDNQLRGRSGRQGDPGSSRFFLSLEDDLMRIFMGERVQMMMDKLGMEENVPIEHPWVSKSVENAQKKVEERNFDIRKHLLEYDDVMNQQRRSIYALRKQVLQGQYRTVPSEEERKKGIEPQPIVTKPDPAIHERIEPLVKQMMLLHAAPPPPENATPEEIAVLRDRALKVPFGSIKEVPTAALERDVYAWFGCDVPLAKHRGDAPAARDHLVREVSLSLTEQRERLLDLVDELVSEMIDEHCPAQRQHEDWDLEALAKAYERLFRIKGTGVVGQTDRDELARKLYDDAEAVLLRKERDLGVESFLRLFRNFYLQEIDRQWIDHLQAMDALRDGIGLRGYGQRDPKKEYKREGFDMFMEMTRSIKTAVVEGMSSVERVREEDLERIEERRRQQSEKRQEQIRATHPGEAQVPGAAASGAPATSASGRSSAPAPRPRIETVRRDRPKVGRNDPCYCGSGKKYKHCHWNEDRASMPDGS